MWGRFWTGIYGFVIPYPDAPSVDVTDELVAQGYNSTTLFELSDDFFASLGLMRMNDGFWKNSVRVSNTCTVWATLNVRFLTNQRGKSVVSSQKSYIYLARAVELKTQLWPDICPKITITVRCYY